MTDPVGGDLDGALAAAQRASGLGVELARTQTVLGFVRLLRFETTLARKAFLRAIELDQGDHLPRLGLGLTLIRDGNLAAGRIIVAIDRPYVPVGNGLALALNEGL